MIFSEGPILRRFTRIQDYIDGYGLGELSPTDLSDVLSEASKKSGLKMRWKWGKSSGLKRLPLYLSILFVSTKSLYTQLSYSEVMGSLSTAVLSVRVRRELKEEAERLGINLREVVERALEEEVERAKTERMRKLIEEALRSIDLKEEEWVKVVKESRLER